jgi:hypothetical protein
MPTQGVIAGAPDAGRPGPWAGGTPSACADCRKAIEAGLARGQNATASLQDLVDQRGFKGSYSSVKHYVRRLKPKRARPHPRIEAPPGEEAQVNYGEGLLVRDQKTGKYRNTDHSWADSWL